MMDMPQKQNPLPLAGIRVLDMTRVVAGPWCTQLLGDLGATVWKVEKPQGGDDTRHMGPHLQTPDGEDTQESAFYMACNRNKHSLAIDVTTPEGIALVKRLACEADIFIENSKAGSLEKLGIGAAHLRTLNPRLITCSITGFGTSGPYSKRPAYDFIMQGMSGLMSTCGDPDGPPMRTAIPLTDIATGLYATIGVLGALFRRQTTGDGGHVDTAMLDVAVALNGHLALGHLLTGRTPGRVGNTNPVAAPSSVYRCADGHIIIGCGNDRQFIALCTALGTQALLEDPRFKTNDLRVHNRAAMDAAVEAALLPHPGAHWLAALEAAGVPCGPINTMPDMVKDPQVAHRDLILWRTHATGSKVPMLRSPLRLDGTETPHTTAPMLGMHTDAVLAEVLHARKNAADLVPS